MRPNNWTETTIGEQATLQRGFDITKAKQRLGIVPVVSSGGISSFHDTAAVKGPGVILGRKGVVGSVHYVESNYWPHDTTLWVKNFHGNDPRFVFYFFKSFSAQLVSLDVGTANPTLNRNHVHPIKIHWPFVHEQQNIVEILAALDDKIQLNHQMNHTLEAMAQAIFKSWFVDFDPVTAKADGRQPYGMNADTAALFPPHFVESEIGPIPEGWNVSSIAELAQYVNGKNFTKNATGTGRMVIRIAELNSGPGASTVYNEVEANEANTAYPGDLLFSWSGSLDIYRWHQDEAVINQHIFKVIPQGFPQWFVYFQLREAISFFQGIAADKATTMGHIKREHLSQAKLALPTPHLISEMDSVIKPLYQRIHQNEKESITLANIRDALLPKLLSGEIRVNEVEKLTEEVA